ncbi:translation initiation factor eIF4e, partial [Conidiobolus coronatus NRRL 28638]
VYNNIVKASELANGGNYHFFRNGIKPEWEDVANAHGGGWKVQFHKRSAVDIDETWLYALLACIGEAFQEEDEICGIVFSTRREFFRISLWTRTSNVRETAENIGKQFKLSLNTNEKLEFTPHHDTDDKNMYFSI